MLEIILLPFALIGIGFCVHRAAGAISRARARRRQWGERTRSITITEIRAPQDLIDFLRENPKALEKARQALAWTFHEAGIEAADFTAVGEVVRNDGTVQRYDKYASTNHPFDPLHLLVLGLQALAGKGVDVPAIEYSSAVAVPFGTLCKARAS